MTFRTILLVAIFLVQPVQADVASVKIKTPALQMTGTAKPEKPPGNAYPNVKPLNIKTPAIQFTGTAR